MHISPNHTNFLVAACVGLSTGYRILTELYIEALLVDEALADEVWHLWDAGVITDDMAALLGYS